jgi:acyl-coenzyme A thioesterase PaaI-like protein
MEPVVFATASAIVPDETGRFLADVHPEWTIAGKPNGGYLLAILGRAAAVAGTHPHAIAASAHYVHSPEPGPVVVEAEVLRGGRSASQVRTRMSQAGRTCVEAVITTAVLDPAARPHWAGGVPDAQLPAAPPPDAVRLVPVGPDGMRFPIMGQVDLRLDRGSTGFAVDAPSGRGELRGWLALPHGETFDPTSLLYAVDALPPATLDVERTGWVPTLELTVYVRALPAPGPVRVLQKAQLIEAQRVDEVCWVWDSTGRLVAHGSQLAGVRLG